MRFHIILSKTLRDLMSLKRTLALVLIGVSLPIIMSFVWRDWFMTHLMSLEMQTHYIIDNFSIILFMWVAGAFLAVMVAATAAGFISKEDTDGTLLLMVSKPVNRFEIMLGKFLALVINAMILEAIVLFLAVLAFYFIVPLDPDSVKALLGLLPWVFLFSLLVTLAFGSLSVAFSALLKSRVKITLVLMLMVMLVFLIGLPLRMAALGAYEGYYLYYLDLGYHLGNTFTLFLDQAESGQMMPGSQVLLAIFTGTYEYTEQTFDPDIGAMFPSLELTNYVSRITSMVIWLGISVVMLVLAGVALQRKEVH